MNGNDLIRNYFKMWDPILNFNIVNPISKLFITSLRINWMLIVRIILEMILDYRDLISNFKITCPILKKNKIIGAHSAI